MRTPIYLPEPVLSDNDEFFGKFQLRIFVSSKTGRRPAAQHMHQADPPRSARITAPDVYRGDTEGKSDPTLLNPTRVYAGCRCDYAVIHNGP
jgi:hypothetical protein